MAEQKKELTETEKNNQWLKDKFYTIMGRLCFVVGTIVAGYMFFTGESLGWIVAGFIGGFIAPMAPFGIIAGMLEKPKPVYTEQQQRAIERSAWLTGKPY